MALEQFQAPLSHLAKLLDTWLIDDQQYICFIKRIISWYCNKALVHYVELMSQIISIIDAKS